MNGIMSERFGTASEESAMLRLYDKTSFYPAKTKVKPISSLKSINTCGCGDRPVSLFCKTDDTFLCKPCKYVNHGRCHVEKIEHVAKCSMNCKELDTTIKELTTLKYVFKKMKENKQLKKLQHRQEKKSMLELSKRWKMLQSTRIALTKEVEMDMDKYESEVGALDIVMARKSRWAVQQVDEYLNEINENLQNGNEAGIYIVLHRARKDLTEFRNMLNEITEDQNHEDIFEGLRIMLRGINHFENQGNVTLARASEPSTASLNSNSKQNNRISTPSERSKSSHSFRRHLSSQLSSASRRFRPAFRPQSIRMASLLSSVRSGRSSSRALTETSIALKNPIADRLPKQFSIQSSTDRFQDYHVSAMCFLHDGKLLVLDWRNNTLKLFSEDNAFITELDLGISVWDFTMIARSEILITCPSDGKLQRVKVTVGTRDCQLAKTGYILTQKDCRAICFVGSRIYISYTGVRPCIKILSKDGIMYRSIAANKGRVALFNNPLYMHVAKLGKIIYVSDFSLQRVAKIDQNGNLHGIIDVSPGWPLGLCLAREEKLIVAVSGSNEIKMIPRGSKWHSLIGPISLGGDPCMITVKDKSDGKQMKQLYVASRGSNVIKIFTLV